MRGFIIVALSTLIGVGILVGLSLAATANMPPCSEVEVVDHFYVEPCRR